MNLKQAIGLIARVVIGAVLIYAGFSKAVAPSAEFAASLANYKILPTPLLGTIAQLWPWIELFTGTYLIAGFYTRLFAGVAAGSFGIFLIVLGSAMARGLDLGSCGCFGAGIQLSPQKTALIDAILLILSLLLAYLAKGPSLFSVDAWAEPSPRK